MQEGGLLKDVAVPLSPVSDGTRRKADKPLNRRFVTVEMSMEHRERHGAQAAVVE
jgi:hypothetical protein